MQKDPYIVLGLEKGATFGDVHDAYHKLQMKYKSECFEEGEVGRNAALKLGEIETAYNDCLEDLKNNATIEETGSVYGEIGSLIKAKKISEAQALLDKIETRDAEWHFYQSIIFYENQWLSESKKQLEIAIALDPNNQKYKDSLQKLTAKMSQSNPFEGAQNAQGQQNQQNTQQQRAGYGNPYGNANANQDACCNTCCTLLCCDSCCECCGGDLISCC